MSGWFVFAIAHNKYGQAAARDPLCDLEVSAMEMNPGQEQPVYFLKDAFVGKKIVVAICTHNRRASLFKVLEYVSQLKTEAYYDVTLLIVENEREPKLADELATLDFPFKIEHASEPRIGLVHARNRSLTEAERLGADWLCMLDDDDKVHPDWLLRFEQAASEFPDGRAFLGFIDVKLPENYSRFLRGSRPRQLKLGANPEAYGTGNCMIGRTVFASDGLGLRFDLRFNTSGAEDTDFFVRVKKDGDQLHHVPEAIIYESCSGERLTYRYHFRRRRWQRRNGLALSHIHDGTATSWRGLLGSLYRDVLLCIWGGLIALGSLASRPKRVPQRLGATGLRVARILGTIDYCCGKTPTPYDVSRKPAATPQTKLYESPRN
ncbi:MAG: glycosyltransferase [Pseudomonadota bacterium]